MSGISLTVNGRIVRESVEPREHLADLLRERLNLTATHLRCEQGVCGACTLLIDGQPARSCITYASLCDGAEITTLEGLEQDPVMAALRRAFSAEHALQCGYCTPGMLVTARDIVLRLPDADAARIRLELSGNLCRCTGYVGIVRAIARVLDERRRGAWPETTAAQRAALGPVGARPPAARAGTTAGAAPAHAATTGTAPEVGILGLGGRAPNVEIRRSITVGRPAAEVWAFLADIAQVAPCMPGASLTRPPQGDKVQGQMAVKLGPVTARFSGEARITRDEATRRGAIMGTGRDLLGGSRAAGEVEYALESAGADATRIDLAIRALLTGPLAQFGRSGIVEDLVGRVADAFARNLEARLAGKPAVEAAPLAAGALLRQVIAARLKAWLGRITGK